MSDLYRPISKDILEDIIEDIFLFGDDFGDDVSQATERIMELQVPVEPDTVITTNGNAPVFLGMDAGTYFVFEVPDE